MLFDSLGASLLCSVSLRLISRICWTAAGSFEPRAVLLWFLVTHKQCTVSGFVLLLCSSGLAFIGIAAVQSEHVERKREATSAEANTIVLSSNILFWPYFSTTESEYNLSPSLLLRHQPGSSPSRM